MGTRVGLVLQAGTLEEVLLLARGILCAYLLAVDALYGETLIVFYRDEVSRCVSCHSIRMLGYVWCKSGGIEMSGITFGAKFHERRVHVLIDRSTHFERKTDSESGLSRSIDTS